MNLHLNNFFQRFVVLTQYIFIITCNLDFLLFDIMHSKIAFSECIIYFFPLLTCLYYVYYVGYIALLSCTAGIRHNKNTMNVQLSLINDVH